MLQRHGVGAHALDVTFRFARAGQLDEDAGGVIVGRLPTREQVAIMGHQKFEIAIGLVGDEFHGCGIAAQVRGRGA